MVMSAANTGEQELVKPSYLWFFLLTASGVAAENKGAHHGQEPHHSPYVDQTSSEIAALSPEEIKQLRNGAGMGLARAAELNSYPGPKHVLELRAELALSPDQATEVEQIRRAMLAEARRIGEVIIQKESTLDRRFEHRHINGSVVGELTTEIAKLRGGLRFAHLIAHIKTAAVLTPNQLDQYDILRGYKMDES